MKKKRIRNVISNYDFTMVLLVLILAAFGIIMVYSSSYYNAEHYYQDPYKYLKRQSLFFGLGFVGMIIVSMIDYRRYLFLFKKKYAVLIWTLYFICAGLQSYTLIKGYSSGGSQRWIKLFGGQSFQPSEVSKVAAILITAYLIAKMPYKLKTFFGLLRIAGPGLLLVGLVVYENLTTGIVMAGIIVIMCFAASKKKMHCIVLVLLGLAAGFVLTYTTDYRWKRIVDWYTKANLESGSQTVQGLYAITSGGFFGKGLGAGIQKLGNISEVHTDMIFSIVCEELGMFGAILVLTVILMLLLRIFMTAIEAPDLFGAQIATGVFAHIALQVLINIAVVTNSIPSTGVPLPFISYGGTALFFLMIEIGLVLSVSKFTYTEEETDE